MVIDEKVVFVAALALSDARQREAYLQQACAGDPELLARILQLLSAHDESQGPLDRGPVPLAAAMDAASTEAPGMVLGPYKLIEPIGEGGMGTVWMAQQTEPVKRLVALKLIKPGMDSKQVIARFEAERQALALMDHPNIARIYDAGMTGEKPSSPAPGLKQPPNSKPQNGPGPGESQVGTSELEVVCERGLGACALPSGGRPYFVMELVRGVPITRYCDEHHLTPRRRLELLLPVCQAVQHAHQKGIIHRDLKPSNVMIALYDGRPVPKVIDFGVAKAAGQPLTEQTLVTGFGAIVGTLEYMSPEQAEVNQLDIDTRSDIYSLGVLLYELLTGTTPLERKRVNDSGLIEALRIIREEEVPTLSNRLGSTAELPAIAANRGTEPAKLTKLVRGELDWIVMKALEKDRNRRYDTANAFAMDVQRYLADEPVLACPPSVGYRMRKFARRNKGALATIAVVLAAFLLGIVGTSWQAIRATQQRDRAVAAESLVETRLKAETQARRDAQSERQKAEAAREDAETHRQLAEHQRAEAVRQEAIAQSQRSRAEDEHRTARRNLYAAHMNLAQQAFDGGQAARMLQLLEGQRPAPGQEDLRGFEWYYLWRLANHGLQRTLHGHTSGVKGVAFSPDGRTVATGSIDATVRLWDVATGRETAQLKTLSRIRCLAFSPDGKSLAAGLDQSVHVWDLNDTLVRSVFRSDVQHINGLAFSHDGALLAMAGGNWRPAGAELTVWNLASGEARFTVKAQHVPFVECVVFSPDDKTLVTGHRSSTQNLRLWDVATGEEQHSISSGQREVFSVAISPDGKTLASGSEDRTVKLWDFATAEEQGVFDGSLGTVYSVAFSPDGNTLALGSMDGNARLWDPATGHVQTYAHSGPVFAVAFSPDGKLLATGSHDATTKLWDTATKPEQSVITGRKGQLTTAILSADGQTLAFTNTSRTVMLCDAGTGEQRAVLKGHTAIIYGLAFSPDGKTLATGSYDGTARLWDTATGEERLTLRGHSDVKCVAFSPDGKLLATGSYDRTVKLWESDTGRALATVAMGAPDRRVSSLAFSPDGKILATGLMDGTTRLSEVPTGRMIVSFSGGYWGWTYSVAFSPDGRMLASCAQNGDVSVWELATWQLRARLKGHTAMVRSMAFLPDNTTLVTAGDDWTIKLWDTATWQERATLKGHAGAVLSVAVSADGTALVTAGDEGTVRLWRAPRDPEALARKSVAFDPDGPDSAQAYKELGNRYLSAGRISEAEVAYHKAIELDPNHAHAHNNLGLALYQQGKLDEAIACYRTAIELDPNGAYAHSSLGLALVNQKKLDEAIASFRTAIELDPKGAYAHNNLGHALYQQGKLDEATASFRTAIELDPKGAKSHSNLGLALVNQKKLDEAIASFRTAIELDPKGAHAHNNLGHALYQQGKLDEATASFRTAIELDPKGAHAHSNLGLALVNHGKLDEAIASFHKAIELDPKYTHAHNNLGVALRQQGKLDEAIACFHKAIELDPNFAAPHYYLGNALYYQKKLDEAIASYHKAIELNPNHTMAHNNLGQALYQQEKLDEAIGAYGRAMELEPENATLLNNAAWFVVRYGGVERPMAERTVEWAEKATQLAPQAGYVWNTLGVAHYRAGQWRPAIEALEKSEKLEPENHVAFDGFFRAMAHWQLGQFEQARTWYDRAVEWMDENAPDDEELIRFRAEAQSLLGEQP